MARDRPRLRARTFVLAARVRTSVELYEFGARRWVVDGEGTATAHREGQRAARAARDRQPNAVARDELAGGLFDA